MQGVGKGSQECVYSATIPVRLEDGTVGDYTAPVVPRSAIPPLLGLRTLKIMRAIINVYDQKIYTIGPGDVDIRLPPDIHEHHLEEAAAGHLLLPITEFQQPAAENRARHVFAQQRPDAPLAGGESSFQS